LAKIPAAKTKQDNSPSTESRCNRFLKTDRLYRTKIWRATISNS